MRTFALHCGLACCALVLCVGRTASGGTRIELVIDEALPHRSVAWPVTTGVPFAEGTLANAEQCRLVDDQGAEQPLQTKVAATWNAERTSIRWLTIDFIAHAGRRYVLEFGADIRPKAIPPAISVMKGENIVVRTGSLQIEFAQRSNAVLKDISFDLNGDRQFSPDERIAGGAPEGDHLFVDQQHDISSNLRDANDRQIVVENAGPVRACVRVDGWYTNAAGRRIVGYRTRYHLFAGLPIVKVIDEFRIVGSTKEVQFRDIALPWQILLDAKSRRVTIPKSESANDTISTPWTNSTRAISLVQDTYRHYGNPECRGYAVEQTTDGERVLQDAERTGPWMQVVDDRFALTASLRGFWQQFPKQWEVTSNRLTLHLWSPRVAPLDFGANGLRAFFGPAGAQYLLDWTGAAQGQSPIADFFYFAGHHGLRSDGADGLGINKHHEIWYHFAPAAAAKQGEEYGRLADQPPLCLATGEWNVGTGVFGPLAARPNASPYEAIVDRIFDLERYAQDTFGDYGWFLYGAGPHYSYQWDPARKTHYADPRRFEYHTYQRETQLWWSYLRSGERKFYDWALPSENHWVDIAVAHVPTKYSTEWRGGKKGEATLHYPAGDWSIDSPLHYVRHHDTGEAWLRSAAQYWATYHRTLETTTLAYYLTGDERFNDVISFWRDYWGALAGVRSDSADVKPWHCDQIWFVPTKTGEPSTSWAVMLRDYAPFQSGSRHQMTLFFNLATLYEHTWNPAIRRVLDEYAAAFIDPDAPNGVWQCQDHRLPANANSPMLAHYWAPALWKYARASRDPRMPAVFKKYFTACYEADPYGGDVGIYSNNQIAWAWHFTKDPRHLIAAQHELDELLPNAAPLAKPEDLGQRIYNPYAPIKSLAAVPRLIGALEEARRLGVQIPPAPPLTPQRTLIAVQRKSSETLRGVLWGWDRHPEITDDAGRRIGEVGQAIVQRSHRQPFDRVLPDYQVFRNEFSASPAASSWSFLSPQLETGILELSGADRVWCWSGEPVRIEPRQTWWWRRTEGTAELQLESAQVTQFRIAHRQQILPGKVVKKTLTVSLADVPANAELTIECSDTKPAWFRLNGGDDTAGWVTTTEPRTAATPPIPAQVLTARRHPAVDSTQTFITGKFGQALLVVPGRELRIPDELLDGEKPARRLSDPRQGTIEFWIRRFTDERLTTVSASPLMTAGSIYVPSPANVPLDEWAHIAVVWRPLADVRDQSLVHVYVNGVDFGFYRSIYWEGYGAKPPMFQHAKEWLKEFLVRAPLGTMFAIDDIRISNTPRYANLQLDFGRQQTYNPDRFAPSSRAAEQDVATVLLLPLDGNVNGTTADGRTIQARLKP